jgi:hypothetical protein
LPPLPSCACAPFGMTAPIVAMMIAGTDFAMNLLFDFGFMILGRLINAYY